MRRHRDAAHAGHYPRIMEAMKKKKKAHKRKPARKTAKRKTHKKRKAAKRRR